MSRFASSARRCSRAMGSSVTGSSSIFSPDCGDWWNRSRRLDTRFAANAAKRAHNIGCGHRTMPILLGGSGLADAKDQRPRGNAQVAKPQVGGRGTPADGAATESRVRFPVVSDKAQAGQRSHEGIRNRLERVGWCRFAYLGASSRDSHPAFGLELPAGRLVGASGSRIYSHPNGWERVAMVLFRAGKSAGAGNPHGSLEHRSFGAEDCESHFRYDAHGRRDDSAVGNFRDRSYRCRIHPVSASTLAGQAHVLDESSSGGSRRRRSSFGKCAPPRPPTPWQRVLVSNRVDGPRRNRTRNWFPFPVSSACTEQWSDPMDAAPRRHLGEPHGRPFVGRFEWKQHTRDTGPQTPCATPARHPAQKTRHWTHSASLADRVFILPILGSVMLRMTRSTP